MKLQTTTARQGAGNGAKRPGAWPRRVVFFLFGCLPALLGLAFGVPDAKGQVSREYELKAVFLYNFVQFTDWPSNAFASADSPIVIGILGPDPFGPALPNTVRGETIHGHPFAIKYYRRADEIKTCDILFISQSETRRVNEIVRSLKGKPILTVADVDAPSSSGAIIRFVIQNNKVHFRVNQEAAAAANITLSSKLLRVADVVPPEKER